MDSIGSFDGTVALCQATDFVRVGRLSEMTFATLAQLPILGELTGVRIKSVAMKRTVLGRGLGVEVVGISKNASKNNDRNMLQWWFLRSCLVGMARWCTWVGDRCELAGVKRLRRRKWTRRFLSTSFAASAQPGSAGAIVECCSTMRAG